MFLIITALWVLVFVPSWFRRSEDRQMQRTGLDAIRLERKNGKLVGKSEGISKIAQQNFRLRNTRNVSALIAGLSFFVACVSLFLSVSQNFYLLFSAVFSVIFVAAVVVVRAAHKKIVELQVRSNRSRSAMHANSVYLTEQGHASLGEAEKPVDTREWERIGLPQPRSRIGELDTPTLAEVFELSDQSGFKKPTTLDSSALDEILRRRRANG